MGMEILISLLPTLNKIGFGMLAVSVIFTVFRLMDLNDYRSNEEERKKAFKRIINAGVSGSVIGILLLCVPTLEDLVKTRIGLIKYELTSKENVNNAAETIERIGKKLECKYLGCKEESK